MRGAASEGVMTHKCEDFFFHSSRKIYVTARPNKTLNPVGYAADDDGTNSVGHTFYEFHSTDFFFPPFPLLVSEDAFVHTELGKNAGDYRVSHGPRSGIPSAIQWNSRTPLSPLTFWESSLSLSPGQRHISLYLNRHSECVCECVIIAVAAVSVIMNACGCSRC